jgi:ankyrin repeat protein/mono/diheme cytochrome c family protein
MKRCIALALCALMYAGAAPAAVDYARDIQPLFEKHCYECHGPKKQKNGFRLDRRSRAFSGMTRHNIIPGNRASSRVYRRVLDGQFGLQMPPEHALSPEEVALIGQWIDAGAIWPDELANEVDAPPPDPAALALIEQIRGVRDSQPRRAAVLEVIAREPRVLNARGPDGASPLMYLALYGDPELLRAALAAGGNPNQPNDAQATALMWAADDAEKVRVLLQAGANANAESVFGRTPLWIAAAGLNEAAVEALLAHGASPSPQALSAAAFGSEPILRRLVAAGARDKGESAAMALRVGCLDCLDIYPPGQPLKRALSMLVPPGGPGDPALVRAALDHGADVNARDLKGRTVLTALALSEQVTPELMQELIDRGVDLNATGADGMTALDHAARLGRAPIVEVLARHAAKPAAMPASAPAPRPVARNSARAAAERVLPLLQASSKQFYDRGGCVACHHNLQLAFTLKEARRAGLAVDEAMARDELSTLARDLDVWRDQSLQGVVAPGGAATTTGYLLMALDAQGHPADASTDAQARLLRLLQRADGRWLSPMRPPIEYSEFTATAVSVRGLTLYGSDNPAATRASIARAARWLEGTAPANHEDRVFRLLGLVWVDAAAEVRAAAVNELLKTQRGDGGWAQTDFRGSDAYATGEALFALRAAGVSTTSRAYKRAVKYLLGTQLEDGSWLVRSRSLPTQAYFESGFPHGGDQFISSAATHWATLALLQTLPDAKGSRPRGPQPPQAAQMPAPSTTSPRLR